MKSAYRRTVEVWTLIHEECLQEESGRVDTYEKCLQEDSGSVDTDT